jgi:predicted amidohydrolase YtcJ
MRAALLIFLIVTAMLPAQTRSSLPDTIFVNANIFTGAAQTFSPPYVEIKKRAQAMSVRGGRIVAIGSNAEITKLKDKRTNVIDLGGHFVMPGFNDAHAHLASGALDKFMNVNLEGVKSVEEMRSRIAERAKKVPAGEWVVGRGWDHTIWADKKLPTRQDIDAVTQGHTAVFSRVDGHIAVANTAAMQAAGYVGGVPDPAGGKVDRDAKAEPTGIVREAARDLLLAKIPPPNPSVRRRAIEMGLREAAAAGVTSIQDSIGNERDPSEWQNFLVYEELENEGKLTARISHWLAFREPLNILETHRAHHPGTDASLHTGAVKAWLDGSLGSRTAALLRPYSDDPSNSGVITYSPTELNELARQRAAAGFQLAFHAIGDRGIEMALDSFADAERYLKERNGARSQDRGQEDNRWRIEHAQVVAPEQFARFQHLKVIASMQPNHLLTDMNWAEARLGPERARLSYPWAEFLRNGVWLAFGTDYPVEPITPFRGLYAAVTRKNEAGTDEYHPEQKLTIEQAIAAYTTGSAYGEFAERDKGLLAPGMLADFVVLDRDPTTVAPAELLRTRVLRTVVGGSTVFEAQ